MTVERIIKTHGTVVMEKPYTSLEVGERSHFLKADKKIFPAISTLNAS